MLGKGIRITRKQNNLTLLELSTKLKIHVNHLGALENERKTPTIKLLYNIAKALKTHPAVLFWNGVDEKEIKKKNRPKLLVFKPTIDNIFKELF